VAGEVVRKFDLIVRSNVVIDSPVRDVWPHFLDMAAWMGGLRFQGVSGKRGEEGEVRLVTTAEDTPYRAFFIKTVRCTPLEQYVLKVTPESGADYLGFADFSFFATDERTHIVYDIYVELAIPDMSEEAFQRLSAEQYATARRDVAANHERLKALVASRCV
jgi:hypothetical protein